MKSGSAKSTPPTRCVSVFLLNKNQDRPLRYVSILGNMRNDKDDMDGKRDKENSEDSEWERRSEKKDDKTEMDWCAVLQTFQLPKHTCEPLTFHDSTEDTP